MEGIRRINVSDLLILDLANKWSAGLIEYDLAQRIMEHTGCCEKVAYSALSRADKRGLIDWGTSIRGSWPTEKGYAFMIMNGVMPHPCVGYKYFIESLASDFNRKAEEIEKCKQNKSTARTVDA